MIVALLLRSSLVNEPGAPQPGFPGALRLLACLGGLALVLGALAGCGVFMKPADTISVDRGAATALWGEVRTTMALSFERRAVECRSKNYLVGRLESVLGSGKLPRADYLEVENVIRQLRDDLACAQLPRQRDQWEIVDTQAREKLSNVDPVIDGESVRRAIEILGKLAGAAL